jgi:hypothetical protein
MRTLVALDLDGTLLDHHACLPAGHEHAVAELRRMGALVAIVTGRPLLTARWAYDHLRLTTPLVAFNGGWLGFPGRPPLAVAMLGAEEVRAVIALLAGWPGALCAYPDADRWLVNAATNHMVRWREWYGVDIALVPEAFAAWDQPSHKLLWVATPTDLPAAITHLRHHLGHRLQVVVSQDDRVEILPRGVHKAWGLERLAAHLGVARERVWAVGDADNDLEMVAWAGHGCAMGQASRRLKDLADHVLPAVSARGLCALPALLARHGH